MLMTQYFFVEDKESWIKVMKVYGVFPFFFGLKPNKSKCEATKGGLTETLGMKCIDLD